METRLGECWQPHLGKVRTINMRSIIIFALALLAFSTRGQGLTLDDIVAIRTMDSLTLKQFSDGKGFDLKEVDIDTWGSVHKYYSRTDNSVSFERTFPTGKDFFKRDTTMRDHRMVYYRFSAKETLKEFRKKIKEKGFKFKRTNTQDSRGNRFTHNIFLTRDDEIDLASDALLGQKTKYTLMYYRRIN
jgi:hypothetical protein